MNKPTRGHERRRASPTSAGVGAAVVISLVLAGCSGGAPRAATTLPSEPQSLSTTTQTTSTQTLTSIAAAIEARGPEVRGGWELRPSDILVANESGVHQVRDGELVADPVSTATASAFFDGRGGMVIQPSDTTDQALSGPRRGALELWHATADGSSSLIYQSDVETFGTDDLTVLDVVLVEPLSQYPSVLFAETRCLGEVVDYCHPQDFLVALPLDGTPEPIVIAAPVGSWEGGITGVAWEQHLSRFIVSMRAEGTSWMTAIDAEGVVLDWPTNPNPPRDDGSGREILAMTGAASGTIGFVEVTTDQTPTLSSAFGPVGLWTHYTSSNFSRPEMLVEATDWALLHSRGPTIAVSYDKWDGDQYIYHVLLRDTHSGDEAMLDISGRASVVGPFICCYPPGWAYSTGLAECEIDKTDPPPQTDEVGLFPLLGFDQPDARFEGGVAAREGSRSNYELEWYIFGARVEITARNGEPGDAVFEADNRGGEGAPGEVGCVVVRDSDAHHIVNDSANQQQFIWYEEGAVIRVRLRGPDVHAADVLNALTNIDDQHLVELTGGWVEVPTG